MIGTTINNYKIISIIGEGGMGTVYLAIHKYLDNKSAIKVLNPQYSRNKDIKDRFINEAVVLSKLNNEYIIKIRDFFDWGDNLFLVMEYAEGITIDKYIREINGPIPENRAVEIFKKILLGVYAAHLKGILHRDLKPSNIILGNDDNPKILDFGIAKLADSTHRLTSAGSRLGSMIYMSPEQILGRDTNTSSDIYSLGITFYEMLTAKNPFDIKDASEYMITQQIVEGSIPVPSSIYPVITRHIEEVISKATFKNPEGRFQNCEDFLDALNNPYFKSGIDIERNKLINGDIFGQNLPKTRSIQIDEESKKGTVISEPIEYFVKQKIHEVKTVPKKKSYLIYYLSGIFILLLIVVSIIVISNNASDNEKPSQKQDQQNKQLDQPKKTKSDTKSDENSGSSSENEDKIIKQKKRNVPKPKNSIESPSTTTSRGGHTTFK